jgi:hypothetical protein
VKACPKGTSKQYPISSQRRASTSITAEPKRPTMQVMSSGRSLRRAISTSAGSIRFPANLVGSLTHTRTNRNSKGACTHDIASNRLSRGRPPVSQTSTKIAPRLRKPIKPPVSNENKRNNPLRVPLANGGFQRTLAIIHAYRKDSRGETQLFAKTRSTTAKPPYPVTIRTGATTRATSRVANSSRKGRRDAVTKAPTREPRKKAASVAANALSMNLNAKPSPISISFHNGA